MGQRLNIEITDGEDVLANAYYHWSAQTLSSFYILKDIIDHYYDDVQAPTIKFAVHLLEQTGAGINKEEKARILEAWPEQYFVINFKDCTDRNIGLLSVTKSGIAETRYWEEGRIEIDIKNEKVMFGVFSEYLIDDFEAETDELLEELPVFHFDFSDIPFDRVYDGVVVGWIA